MHCMVYSSPRSRSRGQGRHHRGRQAVGRAEAQAQAAFKFVDMMMQEVTGIHDMSMGKQIARRAQRQRWTTAERLSSLGPMSDGETLDNRAVTFLRRRRAAVKEQLLPHDPRYKRVF